MCTPIGLGKSAANEYCALQPGVVKAYFFDQADMTDSTIGANDVITAITATAASFKEVNFDTDEAVLTGELAEGFGTIFTHTLTFKNIGKSAEIASAIKTWTDCTCLGIAVVCENGLQYILGYNLRDKSFQPKRNGAGTNTTGTALDTDKTNSTMRTFIFNNVNNDLAITTADLSAI